MAMKKASGKKLQPRPQIKRVLTRAPGGLKGTASGACYNITSSPHQHRSPEHQA